MWYDNYIDTNKEYFMIDKQNIIDKFKVADFMPMVEELSTDDISKIEFSSKVEIFNKLPQFILKLMFKFKRYQAVPIVVVVAFIFVMSGVFGKPFLSNFNFFLTVLAVLLIIVDAWANVNTNVSKLRTKNFRRQNAGDIFWKANYLNSGEQKRFDINNILYDLTGNAAEINAKHVLALISQSVQIGDIYYEDDVYKDRHSDKHPSEAVPYSVAELKKKLPSFIIWRKSVAMLHAVSDSRPVVLDLDDSKLGVYSNDNANKPLLKKLFTEDDSISDIFDEHPGLLGIQVGQNAVKLRWLDEINSDFNSTGAIDKAIILQYEERFYTTLDVIETIQNLQ